MKTRILSILAVLTALVAANLTGVTAANAATSDCYTYSVNGGNATITDGTACSGVVIVPSTLGGFPVTEIGIRAFNHDRDITSISLPNSVTGTGVLVFQDATALKSISFGSGLTVLSQGILGDNPVLESVFLPTSLQRIDGYAFFNCQNLQEITIPAGVTSIGDQAFYSDASLAKVSFAPQSKIESIGSDAFFGTNVELGIPSRDFYNFYGWNVDPAGSGLTVFDPTMVNDALRVGGGPYYAQWSAQGSNVVYFESEDPFYFPSFNPLSSTKYLVSSTVTIRNNFAELARPGFTFAGWNTRGDGSGTAYAAGDNFTMPDAPVFLFAQWTTLGETVSYDANGATDGDLPSTAAYQASNFVTVLNNSGGLLNPGFTFAGWNTEADGTGASYVAGDTFTMPNAPVVLYAQWAPEGSSFSYNSNQSNGGLLPSFVASPLVAGSHIVVQNNSGNLTRPGFAFSGWNTATNGSGTPYAPGDSFDMPETAVVLYAQWAPILVKAASTVAPSISGIAKSTKSGKNVLTASSGVWTGTPTAAISQQWYSCKARVAAATSVIPRGCKAIRGATSATLALKSAQKKKFIAVAVTGQSAGTASTTVLSKSTAKVK